MKETVKKAKASAKPRKSAAKKTEAAVEISAPEVQVTPLKTAEVTSISQPRNVSHDEVARLAHRFWAERGHRHGSPAEDWFRAEQELRGKAS